MPEPRKHHYLPQFYLRNFSKNERQLVQYEKSKDAKSFPTSVGDAGAIRDFHRLDHDETDDAFALEKHLAKLEGTQASMLETLINEGIESPSIHRGELVFFISLMRMRVPPVKQFFEESLREIVRSSGHMLSRNNQLPPMPPDLEEELSPDKWKIEIYNWKVLQHMFMLALDADILSILEKMNISILRSKDNEFVTGDQPVTEYHPDVKANSSEGCALIDSRIELSLPISRNAILFLSWDKNQQPESVISSEQVNEFNRRTIITSNRYIFSSKEEREINELIIQNYSNSAGFKSDTLDFGDGFYHINRFKPVMQKCEYANDS